MSTPISRLGIKGGLGARLMAAFALLAVAPPLLLGALSINRARKDVAREVVRGNLALIRSIGQQLNGTLQDTRRALVVAAAALAVTQAKHPGVDHGTRRTLRALRSEFSILRGVTFLDRKGQRVFGDPLTPGVEFSLDLANTYGGYVSDVLRLQGRQQVFMVVQARDRTGELRGFLAGVVDLGFVQQHLVEARLAPAAALLVVDGNGRTVASTGKLPAAASGISSRESNPAVNRLLSTHAEGHLEFSDQQGREWLAIYRNIAGMSEFRGVRWGVTLLQPTAEAFALARKATRDTILISAVVLLVALGVGAFLARRITRPLASLVRQTELVAAENFESQFSLPPRGDEIGVLAVSFANMVQRLRRSRDKRYALTEFLENLVRSIPVGVISVDQQGVMQSINQAQEQLSEVDGKAVLGLPLEDAFPPREDAFDMLASLQRVLCEGRPEERTINNQATPFTRQARLRYHIRVAPLRNRSGEVDGAVILQEDLSERTRLEAQLIHTEKLSSVGVLAAGVAHEINNPLTTILGYTKLLLENRAPGDPDTAPLELVADEARRVQEIVRNLLDFSRQEQGEAQPVCLDELLRRTLSLVAPDLRKRRVIVQQELCPDLPAAPLDSRRMEQVFVNLITNAAHAMEGGGTLSVATGQSEDRPDQVYVEFRDTGVGIAPEHLSRVFDPFFTTKATGQGTGLGLSVSHGIVTEHGGEIEVESEQGQGTLFRVWLPV